MKKLVLSILLGVAFSARLTTPALQADIIAFTTAGGNAGGSAGSTFGYTFTLSSSVQITQLGFWDYQANGLSAPVLVTLWNFAGVAQANATVPAGTVAGEVNQYLYVALATPVTLAPGTYTIGGYTNGNDFVQYFQNTITPATGITYGLARSVNGSNAFPTADAFNTANGYYGPNFQFTNVVPEPSNWALLAAGAGLLGGGVLRRGRAKLQLPTA